MGTTDSPLSVLHPFHDCFSIQGQPSSSTIIVLVHLTTGFYVALCLASCVSFTDSLCPPPPIDTFTFLYKPIAKVLLPSLAGTKMSCYHSGNYSDTHHCLLVFYPKVKVVVPITQGDRGDDEWTDGQTNRVGDLRFITNLFRCMKVWNG